MANICAIVLNSVSRDARVLKEAASLQAAGHTVTIIGLTDKQFNAQHEQLANGVTIKRVDIYRQQLIARTALRFLACTLIGALCFMVAFYESIRAMFTYSLFVLSLVIASFYLYQLLRQILVSGNEKSVDAPAPITSFRHRFYRIILPLRKIASALLKNFLRYLWRVLRTYFIIRRLKEVKADIVHCHDVHSLPVGLSIKRKTRCKLIYDAHEIYEEVPQAGAGYRLYCRLLHRRAQRHLDGFITINESIAQWYAEHYPAFPKAVIIMNATQKMPSPQYDGRLHDAARLSRDTQILLYQGGFSEHRGLPYLLEAAGHLPPDWALVMMGWGSYEEHLRERAGEVNGRAKANRHGKQAIRFIPPAPQAELAAWTAGATIGVIPYENTGLNHWLCTPNKLWEYPNANVPVLVSPFPELRRPVESYGYGWVLPEDQNPEALGAMIAQLTPAEIAQAKGNCRRFIEENHWEIYAKRLTDAYAVWTKL
jgi:glycosyltransferase involved in cell wall biosynthesis